MFARSSDGYRQLFAVGYRILGSAHDAEDAVQEAFARWQDLTQEQRDLVREPIAWLTRVVSRICLDQLRSARARRESYTGIWLPEPLLGAATALPGGAAAAVDPADAVSLDESVSMALLVTLEQLTPAERVSLIMHDVFGMPFAEIAQIVGRTPDACRQLASTARKQVRQQPRFEVNGPERDRVVQAFAQACADGDLAKLAAVLDPDVVSRADGGGHVRAARRTVVGADAVARYLLGVMDKQRRQGASMAASVEQVNGRSGIVVRDAENIVAVVDLGVVGQRVQQIALVVNPDKLVEPYWP
jgi:RNA polymerase sigma-70 factor (ECF subfamily)